MSGTPDPTRGPLATPTLRTERLTLRALCDADRPAMPGVFSDPEISANTRNIPYPYTDEDAEAALRRHRRLAEEGRSLTLAVCTSPAGDRAGELIGLAVLILHEQRNEAEVGYALGRAWWGRGYATEAAGTMVDYGFGVLGFEEINAHAMVHNPASGRVLEKLGMNPLGLQRAACEREGVRHDVHGFVITREQWEARTTGEARRTRT